MHGKKNQKGVESNFCSLGKPAMRIKSNEIQKIDVDKIISQYDEIKDDALPNDNFCSWDNCRNSFRNAAVKRYGAHDFQKEDFCDICCSKCGTRNFACCDNCLALNLGFYLASWGMYRNSFLNKYDHTIHIEAVKILMDKKYVPLFDPYISKKRNTYITLVSDVFVRLWDYYELYANQISKIKGVNKHVSDTLITKIILGVYGCMPAYDRYFRLGIGYYGGHQSVNKRNIKKVLEELIDVATALDAQISPILNKAISTWNKSNLYTPMRIVDMIFWKIGEQLINSKSSSNSGLNNSITFPQNASSPQKRKRI